MKCTKMGISVAKWAAARLEGVRGSGSRQEAGGRHLGHVACKVNVASRSKKCIMQQQRVQTSKNGQQEDEEEEVGKK